MTSEEKKDGPSPCVPTHLDRGPCERFRREVTSAELLGGGREIHIRHGGEIYTLRRTSNGKLILTK